jgi:uncharacterized protein
MTQPAKVQEPSMEEILASIRRIIADDEAKPAGAEKPAASGEAGSAKLPLQTDRASSAVYAPAKASPSSRQSASAQKDADAMLAGLEATPERAVHSLPDGEVLELTDEMALPTDSFNKIEPEDDLEINEGAAAAQRRESAAGKPRDPLVAAAFSDAPKPSSTQQMLSRTTVSAVESAFNTLANTVLSNNARTLEDLVKEMLRPMLKSWLDDNLPGVVERIVKAEIERVSRGR